MADPDLENIRDTAAKGGLGDSCWLVAASVFCQQLKNQRSTRPVYVFDSSFTAKADMWASFRLPTTDVAQKMLDVLS